MKKFIKKNYKMILPKFLITIAYIFVIHQPTLSIELLRFSSAILMILLFVGDISFQLFLKMYFNRK